MAYIVRFNKNTNEQESCTNCSNTPDFIRDTYRFCLNEEFHKFEDGSSQRCFRLLAKEPHSIESALKYDVKCPVCGKTLKPVSGMLNAYDLFLYACPTCKGNRRNLE